MDTISTPTPLTFLVTSPQELSEILAADFKKSDSQSPFMTLAISGPQVIVRAFHFKNIPIPQVKSKLQAQAVELLSLPLNEIEFDYQIFNSTPEKTTGIFGCMPKNLLKEYLSIIDKAKLIPLKLTAAILACMDSFYKRHPITEGQCCLLDLSNPQKINLAVFHNKECELLREIPCDNFSEARFEVIQTLRSASAASTVKQFDHVFCAGDLHGKEELLAQIEKVFGAKIEVGIVLDGKEALAAEDPLLNLNFIRRHSVSALERKKILEAANIALVLGAAACVLLTAVVLYTGKRVQDLKSSYQSSQYDYARKLEKQIKAL